MTAPWQARVIAEREELIDKIKKLRAFNASANRSVLSPEEQARLDVQLIFMEGYEEVLGQRIAAFS
jgi:hypothetical protein